MDHTNITVAHTSSQFDTTKQNKTETKNKKAFLDGHRMSSLETKKVSRKGIYWIKY